MNYSKHLKACQLPILGDLANFPEWREVNRSLPQSETVPGSTLPDLSSNSMLHGRCCARRFLVFTRTPRNEEFDKLPLTQDLPAD